MVSFSSLKCKHLLFFSFILTFLYLLLILFFFCLAAINSVSFSFVWFDQRSLVHEDLSDIPLISILNNSYYCFFFLFLKLLSIFLFVLNVITPHPLFYLLLTSFTDCVVISSLFPQSSYLLFSCNLL